MKGRAMKYHAGGREEKQAENNCLSYLILTVMFLGIIFGIILESDDAIEMIAIDAGHPFHFPEECNQHSLEKFLHHFQSKPENLDGFDVKAYENTHVGEVICKKPARATDLPGEKILHLYTNGDLDKKFFQAAD